jgi:CubicO group peptidase (beta-lactamase class C family)
MKKALGLHARGVAAMLVLGASAAAQGQEQGRYDAVGFSGERLRRLHAEMRRAVDDGRAVGIVTYVARGGQVVSQEAFGDADREAGRAMKTDTIFRIASMSKAVTSVAAMMLVEEGRLALGDPVSRYIPSFKKTTVFVPSRAGSPAGPAGSVVPAKREITIRDLLTHTSGISYGEGEAEPRYKAKGVQGWYFADKAEPMAEAIDRLATVAFDAQPGERFVYGFSTDVLGVVVEKVSGKSLDVFLRERIFAPLVMSDTSFFLPPEKAKRLAAVYTRGADGLLVRAPEAGMDGQGAYVEGPRQCFSGGAGLLSTARDYGRFLQMLVNGGILDGVRILGPKTVELMTVNHVGALHDEGNTGFGLGFEVVENLGKSGRHGSLGKFSWGGAYYTDYLVDPQEMLVGVFMTQLRPWGTSDLHPRFQALVYQAIVGPPSPLR